MAWIVKRHWRDIIAVTTMLLIISSLYLIGYGIGRSNSVASQTQDEIECIAKFYGQHNRAAATIINVNNCRISR